MRPPFVPLLDGRFDDWSSEEILADDPVGDAAGAFDVVQLSATTRGSDLYVLFEIDRVLNLYSGDEDDGTLRLELRLPDERRMSIDFRSRSATLGSGAVVSWQTLGLVVAPSHAASVFEVRLDMSAFEAAIGEVVEIDFSGSDELAAPVSVPLIYEAGDPPLADDRRAPGTELRVASLNTREAGLVDPSRSKAMARLLRAAAADIYALQELGTTSAAEVEQALEVADPHGDGARWFAHAAGSGSILGNAVVSTDPLVPIPLATDRAVGAVVLRPSGPIAVLSVHLKCCGFQGSQEDAKRFAQVRHLAKKVVQLRQGELGESLRPYAQAPIIVVGDFNHVGSAELLGDFISPRSLGLSQWLLPQLGARDVFTWFGYESAFPPAALDLLLHHGLEPLGGYVLDSARIPRERIEQLGLWSGDSGASDHLMLVADFR